MYLKIQDNICKKSLSFNGGFYYFNHRQNLDQELNYHGPKRVRLNTVQTWQMNHVQGSRCCGRNAAWLDSNKRKGREGQEANGLQVKNSPYLPMSPLYNCSEMFRTEDICFTLVIEKLYC